MILSIHFFVAAVFFIFMFLIYFRFSPVAHLFLLIYERLCLLTVFLALFTTAVRLSVIYILFSLVPHVQKKHKLLMLATFTIFFKKI